MVTRELLHVRDQLLHVRDQLRVVTGHHLNRDGRTDADLMATKDVKGAYFDPPIAETNVFTGIHGIMDTAASALR